MSEDQREEDIANAEMLAEAWADDEAYQRAVARVAARNGAILRGEILVRTLVEDVIATSALAGIALDRKQVTQTVFDSLVRRGAI